MRFSEDIDLTYIPREDEKYRQIDKKLKDHRYECAFV